MSRSRRPAAVGIAVGLLALGLSGCSGGGSSATSAPAAPASPESASASAVLQAAAFAKAAGPLVISYAETAKDYAAAVTGKQLSTAIADSIKLSQTCADEGRLPASGDAELDAAWHRFADGCVTGWNDITQAYQQRDKTLLAQGHAALKAASADYLAAGKRMIALGQQALTDATGSTG